MWTYEKYLDGEVSLLDAHCHIGLVNNASKYANNVKDFKCWSFGVKPSEYNEHLNWQTDNIKVGLGYHPWYIEENEIDKNIEIFSKELFNTAFVGEIGLDFSVKHSTNCDMQIKVFTEICELLSMSKNKIVSIHSVKSATKIFDLIEKYKLLNKHIIILHWFTGTSVELKKALDQGYYFSVGPKMYDTKKGYEYIRQLPENRILVETDMPWENKKIDAIEHYNVLNDFYMKLRELKCSYF